MKFPGVSFILSNSCIYTRVSQKFCCILVLANLTRPILFKPWYVAAVVGSITVGGALTRCALLLSMCDLKSAQMNVRCRRIQELMLYGAKLGHNITEATVTLCRWPAKQTIPLSVLARNQTKGFGNWNLGVAGRGNGTREESWLDKGADGSWRRETERGSRQWTPEQRGEAAWHEGPATVREDESAFQ